MWLISVSLANSGDVGGLPPVVELEDEQNSSSSVTSQELINPSVSETSPKKEGKEPLPPYIRVIHSRPLVR